MKKLLLLLIMFSFVQSKAQKIGNNTILKGSTIWLKGIDNDKTTIGLNKNKAILNLNSKHKIFKRRLSSASSLIVVYTFNPKKETTILNLNKRGKGISLNTTSLVSFGKKTTIAPNHFHGKIATIQFFNTELKRGDINVNTAFFDDTKNAIFELLFFPKYISVQKKQKIETYLAIKYGISLEKKQDYYNSDYQKIWDTTENEDFSNRVFGIGYDDGLGLKQKESIHSEDDFLRIAYSNKEDVSDKQFLLVGDNGKDTHFHSEGGFERVARTWKFNASSVDDFTQYKFILSSLDTITTQDNNWEYKLSVSDSPDITLDSARLIATTSRTSSQLVFDNIKLKEGEQYFTFMKVPKNYQKEKLFKIYPNPVSKNQPLQIYIANPESKKIAITIYTINGQLIFSKEDIVLDKQVYKYQLPSAGVYTVSVTIGDTTSTTKVISK